MSGSAGGLLLVPLVLGIGPMLGIVMVGAALGAAASVVRGVSSVYERQNRAKRERIRDNSRRERAESETRNVQNTQRTQQEQQERIGAFRDSVLADMTAETRRNAQVSDRMAQELERSRNETRALLEGGAPEDYARYLEQIRGSRAETNKKITAMQDEFTRGYREKISAGMKKISGEINSRQEGYMNELRQLRGSEEEKQGRAKEIAGAYLDEAENLLASLRDDFQGAAFSGPRMASLAAQIKDAAGQYNLGQFEACIAAAKDASVAAIEEIYRADAGKQEWENYHKLALMLTAEVETYLKNQEVITAEAKAEVEKRTGRALEDEIVGIKIGDYTDKTASGETQFDFLLSAAGAKRRELESASPASMPLQKLKDEAAALNGTIYPSAVTAIYKGMLNMSNAFTRQNLSEEIVDFFEEHNFTFSGYGYEGGRHDGALRIGLENGVTGEEIVVTLAPEVMSSGEVQTRVAIDQLKGDERNEERKEYYRQAVRDVVAKSLPGSSVNISCDQSTRNRLSSNTNLRDKLKR